MSYGYQQTLELAGAEVLEFEDFGSYQGDWMAKVRYGGREGWVHGYFGSCDHCDAFYAEFGYPRHECSGGKDYYDPFDDVFRDDCSECQKLKAAAVEFGKGYLENMLSQQEAEGKVSENLEWDFDAAQAMLEFVKKHAVKEAR